MLHLPGEGNAAAAAAGRQAWVRFAHAAVGRRGNPVEEAQRAAGRRVVAADFGPHKPVMSHGTSPSPHTLPPSSEATPLLPSLALR